MLRPAFSIFSKRGVGLVEIVIGLGLLGLFAVLSMQAMKFQNDQKKVADFKSTLMQVHMRAQQGAKRYEMVGLPLLISHDNTLKACLNENGTNCDQYTSHQLSAFPGYQTFVGVTADPADVERNKMMNGNFRIDGTSCNPLTDNDCLVRVRTSWNFTCTEAACKKISFHVESDIDPTQTKSAYKGMLAGVSGMSADEDYVRAKSFGLSRLISSTCSEAGKVVTGANLQTGVANCVDMAAVTGNRLFDTDLGYDFQNGSFALAAGGGTTTGGTTGSTTGDPPPTCPPGKVATMGVNGMECTSTCVKFCTTPGDICTNNTCCNPVIPDGGDGWGAWSGCGADGLSRRTCQYPKGAYCNSVCNPNQEQQKPCCPTCTWQYDISDCSKDCGGGQQNYIPSCRFNGLNSAVQPANNCLANGQTMPEPKYNVACNTQDCGPPCIFVDGGSTHDVPNCPGGQYPYRKSFGCSGSSDKCSFSGTHLSCDGPISDVNHVVAICCQHSNQWVPDINRGGSHACQQSETDDIAATLINLGLIRY